MFNFVADTLSTDVLTQVRAMAFADAAADKHGSIIYIYIYIYVYCRDWSLNATFDPEMVDILNTLLKAFS